MSAITTHVLDLSRGCPGAGVPVRLDFRNADGSLQVVGRGETDQDGRLKTLAAGLMLEAGTYCLTFDTQSYFERLGIDSFFPEVTISFFVRETSSHYHVPLLLSPFGYSTYRGS